MKRRTFVKSGLAIAGSLPFAPLFAFANQYKVIPDVVLIGDSIRMGYQPYVENALKGVVNVWGPEENCRTTNHIIYNLHEWIKKQQPALVHMNAGLHDIRTLTYDSRPGNVLVKPVQYRNNLETIFRWIQQNVGCKIIWATTTPVIDEKVKARKSSYTRFDSDVQRINKIASITAKKCNVPVNDLYGFVKQRIGEEGMKKDGVHFVDSAYEQLGKQVSSKIIEELI